MTATSIRKSVISAMLIDMLLERDVLVGAAHFCRFDDATASSPFELLASLAAQLASNVPDFAAALSPDAVQAAAREKGDVDGLFVALSLVDVRTRRPRRHASGHARAVPARGIVQLPARSRLHRSPNTV
jgi:hypothetical protein